MNRPAASREPALDLRVAVLDAHQGIIDGYCYRFDRAPNIKLVVAARNGADFETQLAINPADIALMGLRVAVSADSPARYPILHAIPRLRIHYPSLAIVVVSMRADPFHIMAVMEAGAGGYIVKDDAEIYAVLPQVLASVHRGGVYYSPSAQSALSQYDPSALGRPPLTPRQLQALSLCAAYPRHTITEIAQQMGVSASTARNLLSQTYARLGVTSRFEAILHAEQIGLLPPRKED